MALWYAFGFDVTKIGHLAFDIADDGGGAYEGNITSGTFCGVDISAIASGYTDFATALATELNATSSGAGTYTVTEDATSWYTVAYDNGNFTLGFSTVGTATEGTRLRQLLGFSGDQTGAASYTSDIAPYYMMLPQVAGRSLVTREFMPSGIAADAEADDGSSYGVARGTSPLYYDWSQVAETKAVTFKADAAAGAPWTWQHAWEHAANVEPFLVTDGSEQAIHKLRGVGSAFHPTMMDAADWDNLWSLPFMTRLLGRL